MSTMRNEDKVIAIFLADIHLSLKPPIWRSAEDNWLEAQARVLREVSTLQKLYECPVICAGDIFDRNRKIADGWDAPAELINFALDELPDNMYAIPGQHDLPNHQYENIHRSAYKTLVECHKIKNIAPRGIVHLDSERLFLFGVPPGYEISSIDDSDDIRREFVKIAVVHDYIWMKGYSYPDAPDEKRLSQFKYNSKADKFYGYDVVVYGDNHKGFTTYGGQTIIFNCGTLMRRKSDEIDYKPQVGLLLESGKVRSYYLDTSQDKYIEKEQERVESNLDMGEFFEELEKLGKTALDFKEAMKQFLHSGRTSVEAKEIILKAMEK